jgi:para-aminobenzoate synthetase/4-amino-4-deoxychorismate lyase
MVNRLREGGNRADSGTPPGDPAQVFRSASGATGSVLLETQRPEVRERFSYLFSNPKRVLECSEPGDVPALLLEAGEWQVRGHAVAGYVSYEAGFALDPVFEKEADLIPRCPPLLWFGVYPGYLRFDHLTGRWDRIGQVPEDWTAAAPLASIFHPRDRIPEPRFSLSEKDHGEKVEAIRGLIEDGFLYQANLTGKFVFPYSGDPYAFYMRMRAAQPVPFGAFLRMEKGCIVSQSPELFFRVRGDRIETRPMKGTAPRGISGAEDRKTATALRNDSKNRAENVMIVDLLRNDLGRLCRPGSIRVGRLFEVQRFRTLMQMVSTVSGVLAERQTPLSLFRSLFPCGSVTGAPKISAMRILRELEEEPRGIYTGAIGAMLPGGDMAFSVAIRTITIAGGRAEAGAGGGIVWDSTPADEFREARQKAQFLLHPPLDFHLVETFLLSPDGTFRLLAHHLRRLAASARYFGFRYRRETVLSALEHAAGEYRQGRRGRMKVRILLGKGGNVSVETSPLAVPTAERETAPLLVTLSDVAVSSRDPFVHHKTTNRAWRDAELGKAREAGYDEVLFLNERGELAEGAITNVFLEISGRLYTPPPSSGLLEGVFRRHLLKDRTLRISERVLMPEDLGKADRVFLTNSVRGMQEARLSDRIRDSLAG